MSELKICDYSDYDYKTEFWSKANRKYEHTLEIKIVKQILKTYCHSFESILDAGCGFGRMAPSYQNLFKECHMVDYAKNLLTQAKGWLNHNKKYQFYEQSLYDLKINKNVDAIISIRTLHHLNDIEKLFNQYHSCLNENGILILDVPNLYHLKNKLKQPFSKRQAMRQLSETFYNYDPNYIIEKLNQSGFNIMGYRQVGLFRIKILKKIIPANALVNMELFLNKIIKDFKIGPSVYVIAKRCG
ncbi:MAG: class I SAM-dependent methyltransferase [Candidatus Margulisiibacteriota bacterium]